MSQIVTDNPSKGDILKNIREFYRLSAIVWKTNRTEEGLYLKCKFALKDKYPEMGEIAVPFYRSPEEPDGRVTITIYMEDLLATYIRCDRSVLVTTAASTIARGDLKEAFDELNDLLSRQQQMADRLLRKMVEIVWLIYRRQRSSPDICETVTTDDNAINIRQDIDLRRIEE